MKRALPILLAVAFVSAVTFAQVKTSRGWEVGSKSTALYLNGPVYLPVAPAVGVFDAGNGIVATGVGHLDYDFPTLGGASAALDTVCAESGAMTVTGVRFGDTLLLGVDQALVNAFGTVTAFVSAADAVKVRACASGITDGGSFNQPDSGYTVRFLR